MLLTGARQTGKTTLVQALAQGPHPAKYVTLDDATAVAAARADPVGFIQRFSEPVVLDEVQHTPELFPAIKMSVDRDRRPGRFLMTGSANVPALPRLSESLAGRMEVQTLWPLAQSEVENGPPDLVDRLLREQPVPASGGPVERDDLIHRLVLGGYPEPRARDSDERRRAWFGSYVSTILQRDVRDIANVEALTALPSLLAALAARSASLLNLADVSRSTGLPYTTLQRYMVVLQAAYLVRLLPAWSSNLSTRLAKSPKVLLNDPALVAALLGAGTNRLQTGGALLGSMLETFVAMELQKAVSWSAAQPRLCHSRSLDRREVDLVLEDRSGSLVGLEVKASATVSSADFDGLRALAAIAGERFLHGIVLYAGGVAVPFGERLTAVPLSVLWQ